MIQIQVVSIPQFTQKMKRHFSRESTSLNITAERMESIEITDYGHPIKINFGVFSAELSSPILVLWVPCQLFLKKTKPLYPHPKYLFVVLQRIRDSLSVSVVRDRDYRRTEKKTRKCVEWLTCTDSRPIIGVQISIPYKNVDIFIRKFVFHPCYLTSPLWKQILELVSDEIGCIVCELW
jgi:hypothetical protein